MSCVLLVNQDKIEGKLWCEHLEKKGYTVLPECLSVSSMVNTLMREKVHIIVCSAKLVNSDAIEILKASVGFFPRIKIIIVGFVEKAFILSRIGSISIAEKIDSALGNCPYPTALLAVDSKNISEQALSLLLGEHYFSQETAAILLAQSFKWTPKYALIGVTADSAYDDVFRSLQKAVSELRLAYLMSYRPDEFYIVLDGSPSQKRAVGIAGEIRHRLLKETDAMFSVGISRSRHKAGELYVCRKEALRACRATHMFGQNATIHINYLDSGDIEYAYPKHKEKRLIEATMDGDTSYAFQMLDEIFEVLRASDGLKQGHLNKIVLGIVVNLSIASTSRVSAFERMNLDSLALSRLLAAKTVDEVYAFMKQGIKDFAEEMDAFSEVSREALFYKLVELKKENKQVSILDLAGMLGTTTGFINAAIYRNCGSDIFSFFLPDAWQLIALSAVRLMTNEKELKVIKAK